MSMLRKAHTNLPQAVPYLTVTLISLILFYPTWWRLLSKWLQFEQVLVHGLATAALFIGLLLLHPPLTARNADAPSISLNKASLGGGLALVATVLVWLLIELARIDTIAYLLLPVGLAATCWTLLGWAATRAFLPYLLLLSLSLPIWADLVPPLVAMASAVVGTWVQWMGMTALIEGHYITLPYGRLVIADGCSGIRYFAIAILLSMVTAVLNDYRWRGWLACLGVAVALSLLANWVRITILVVVAYATDMESALITDHEFLGWVVFAFFIGPALYLAPVKRRQPGHITAPGSIRRPALAFVVAVALLGPVSLAFFQAPGNPKPPWTLELVDARVEASAGLPLPMELPGNLDQKVWQSGPFWYSLAQTQKRQSNDKLVPYLRPPVDKDTWQLQQTSPQGVRLYRNIFTREQVVLAQWYQVGQFRAQSYQQAKLLQIPATLSGQSRFALVTAQLACDRLSCDQALLDMEAQLATLTLHPRDEAPQTIDGSNS